MERPGRTGSLRAAEVETRHGIVAGRRVGRVLQWRGIPYAAPPVGSRRWCPPEPPSPWAGARDATAFGPAAPQPPSKLQLLLGTRAAGWQEDCLYLNVFAPADGDAKDGNRGWPVMVWIHGGAFIGGSGSVRWYDGSTFASRGAVVVTINYRLGALGFLDLSSVDGDRCASSGNCGLLDQTAALRWVRDNIAGFGGDPGRITVFGQSAGAMSIGALLAMPAAAGLFHRAILESGSTGAHRTREQAARVTTRMLDALGADAGVDVDRLRELPVQRIVDAQLAVTRGSDFGGYLSFRPVVDGVDLPESPASVIAGGSATGVRVLVGTNADEMTLFLAYDPGALPGEDDLERRVTGLLGPVASATLGEGYRLTRPETEPAARLSAMLTDLVFRIPAVRLAEAVAAAGSAPAWVYRFDWPSPLFGGRLGATHSLEIPFVWDILDLPGVALFTGEGRGRRKLADSMHRAWLAFAASGDPSIPQLPPWPAYRPPERATMVFDADCRVEEDPGGAERALWDGIV